MNYTIENIWGIDCIFAPMKEANSVTIQIMCKAGSVYETLELNGIAHFQEHMFFKGGKKYPTPKAVAEAVDRFGGEFNAGTGNDEVAYFVKCAPQFLEQGLDVLADMMMDAQFDPEELEKEKQVVIQEIKMYEDNPAALVGRKWKQRYFGPSSYGRGTLGTIASVSALTREDLVKYKQNLYTKDNMLIVIAGNITDEEGVKQLIAEYFSGLPSKAGIMKPAFDGYLPREHRASFEKGTEQNHIIISARGFSGIQEQKYAAKLLAHVLGGSMSSRLFQKIREEYWLCYYVGANHSAGPDFWSFTIKAGIDKERFDFGMEKIFEEVEAMVQQGISQEELEQAKGFLSGKLQMGIESSDELADFLGEQYLQYQEIITLEEIVKKYEALTLEEVNGICSLLTKENLYFFSLI